MQGFTPPHHNITTGADKAARYRLLARSLVLIILIFSAAAVSLRCYFWEPISDDLLYRYVLDEAPLGANNYVNEVTGFSDAVKSQTIQYFHSNGRVPVHVLVQMFAGPWGHTAYSVFGGILMLTIIILFTFYTIAKSRRTPLAFFLAVVMYLYLFQEWSGNWYSIAEGMNYLLPMLPVLCTLFTLRWINRSDNNNRKPWTLILLALLGFATGWSHECFSIPLSGGVFFWAIKNFKKNGLPFWTLTFALWIGTIVLILAPGNFVRLASRPGILMTIANGVTLLAGTWIFWLMLAGIIVIRISGREKFRKFLASNTLELYMVAISVAFGMVANNLPQSFNGISFFSAIVLFRMTAQLPEPSGYSLKEIILTALLAVLLFTHQTRLILACREQMQIDHQFVEDYIASPDGVMAIPRVTIAPDCRPFLISWLWFSSPVRDWRMLTLEKHYGKGKKHLALLEDQDYEAYSSPEKFMSGRESVPCDVEAYHGNKYLWFKQDDAPRHGDTVRVEYARPPATGLLRLYHSLIRRPRPAVIERKVVVDSMTLVNGISGLVGVQTGMYEIKNVEILRAGRKS